jgi:hypothetical protein
VIPICACAIAATSTVAAANGGGGGLDAGDYITLAGVVVAFLIGIAGLVVTILMASKNIVAQQKNVVADQEENRRQERAKAYAEAIRAVDDYLETPYRIRRRDGSGEHRWQLTESISEIQSRINFHKGWLRINASKEVYDAYVEFIKAAKAEAGGQMTTAWNGPATKKDRQVPLGARLPQPKSEAAKEVLVEAMKKCLKR